MLARVLKGDIEDLADEKWGVSIIDQDNPGHWIETFRPPYELRGIDPETGLH